MPYPNWVVRDAGHGGPARCALGSRQGGEPASPPGEDRLEDESKRPSIAYIVPGELWEMPARQQTLRGLAEAGLSAEVLDYGVYHDADHYLEYGETFDRLAARCLDRDYVVCLAAGSLVRGGFREAVLRCLRDGFTGLSGHILCPPGAGSASLHRQCLIFSTRSYVQAGRPSYDGPADFPAFSRSRECVHDDYTPWWIEPSTREGARPIPCAGESRHFLAAFLRLGIRVRNLPPDLRAAKAYLYHHPADKGGRLVRARRLWRAPCGDLKSEYTVRRGAGIYQAIARLAGDPARAEPELDPRGRDAAEPEGAGEIYAYNTEPLRPGGFVTRDPDTLVVLGAGLKPWALARRFCGPRLKRLVVVDVDERQLAFAARARRLLETEDSWLDVCRKSGYRHRQTLPVMPGVSKAAEAEFRRIRRSAGRWDFDVRYVRADLTTQAFGLADYLESLGARRLVFWISNVFSVYLKHSVVHQPYVERSFCRLFQDRFERADFLTSRRWTRLRHAATESVLAREAARRWISRAVRFLARARLRGR